MVHTTAGLLQVGTAAYVCPRFPPQLAPYSVPFFYAETGGMGGMRPPVFGSIVFLFVFVSLELFSLWYKTYIL